MNTCNFLGNMIQCRYKRCNCIPCMRCKTKTPDGGRGFLFHEVPFPANQCLSSCDTCPWPHSIMLKPCNFFENVIQCKHKWGNCMSCMRCRTKTPDGRRGFSIPIFGRGLISRLTACCRSICQAICRYNASLHLPKETQKMSILESCMHPLSLDWRWQQLHYSI